MIIKGELEILETLSGVLFSPVIVNWLSVFVVVEENALYVYANQTSLMPSQVVRVESMYVEQVSRRESGRDFCFIVSNAANLYVFSAKNEALQKGLDRKIISPARLASTCANYGEPRSSTIPQKCCKFERVRLLSRKLEQLKVGQTIFGIAGLKLVRVCRYKSWPINPAAHEPNNSDIVSVFYRFEN